MKLSNVPLRLSTGAYILNSGITKRDADQETIDRAHEEAHAEAEAALEQALTEPRPAPADVEKFTYAPSEVDAVYPGDYTGLPGSV